MRKVGMAVAIGISLLSAGGAAWCHHRSATLQNEGAWLLERGNAQAEEYAQRFDGAAADAQLQSFAQRRTVLERAHVWQRGQMLGVMGAALGLVAAYAFFLLRRLDEQLADAMPDVHEAQASSEPVPALVPNASLPR